MKLEKMTDRQLDEYADRVRVAAHCGGRLDMEEFRIGDEYMRRERERATPPKKDKPDDRTS